MLPRKLLATVAPSGKPANVPLMGFELEMIVKVLPGAAVKLLKDDVVRVTLLPMVTVGATS